MRERNVYEAYSPLWPWRKRVKLFWCRTGYRPWARLLHRFNLHHTRRIGPIVPDGSIVHKCEWCGLSRVEQPLSRVIVREDGSLGASHERTGGP